MKKTRNFLAFVMSTAFSSNFVFAASPYSDLLSIAKGEIWASECLKRGLDAQGNPEPWPLNGQSSQSYLSKQKDGTSYTWSNIYSKADCQGEVEGIVIITGVIDNATTTYTINVKTTFVIPLTENAVNFVKVRYASPECHIVKGMPIATDCSIDEITAKMPETADIPISLDPSGKEMLVMGDVFKKID